MRFTHTADCHIGGHRDPRMRALTEAAFERFISESIEAKIDFVIIAGDLFNTAIPGIDTLKFTVTQLGRLREKSIPVYAIPGSHDFSPSGKTMLDVLEEAGLLRNVCRGSITDEGKLRLSFTRDKSGAKLTGVIGRRGMLDRQIYEELDQSISEEPGEKIFIFHTALTELKPANLTEMESAPISFLPRGFTYYAGGHVHIVQRYDAKGYSNVVYPGPLFPNSFSELEHLGNGGYYLYDNGELVRREIMLRRIVPLLFTAEGMDSKAANAQLQEMAHDAQVESAIVLLRVEGTLSAGNPTDIDLRGIVHTLESRGAYIVLRNTSKLTSPEFIGLQLKAEEPHNIEESLLTEHADQLMLQGASRQESVNLARDLLRTLSREPHEGEKVYEYQDHLVKDAMELLDKRRERGNGA